MDDKVCCVVWHDMGLVMPAKEIMHLFKEGKLHSGGSDKIVTNPHQAKAIQMSYARKEGARIPPPKGMRPRGKFGTTKGK